MADQLDINEALGPLFTIKVIHYVNAWNANTNPPFAVLVSEPVKQMFTLSVGLKSTTYQGPQGIQGLTGATGATGPQGPTGADGSSYEHVQASALTEWIVNHNLDKHPVISVITTGGVEVIVEIIHMSTNQARIYFNQPQAGKAMVR